MSFAVRAARFESVTLASWPLSSTFHLHPPSFSPPPRHPSALDTSVIVMDERNVDERIVGFASGSNYEVQELIGLSFSSRLI